MISDSYTYLCNIIVPAYVSVHASNSSRWLNTDNLLSKCVLPPFSVCAEIPNHVVAGCKFHYVYLILASCNVSNL